MFSVSDKVVCVDTTAKLVLGNRGLYNCKAHGLVEGTVYVVRKYSPTDIFSAEDILDAPVVDIVGLGWKLACRFRKLSDIKAENAAKKAEAANA